MLSLFSPFYLVPKLKKGVIGKGWLNVNAPSRIEFESVCNFFLCLWERWLFHSSSLLKVAVWLRGEVRALRGNTVGGCALQSLGEPLGQWTWLLCSSGQLEVHPAWRGSEHRIHEWKQKSDVEELWIESLLHALWRKPKTYLLSCEDKLIQQCFQSQARHRFYLNKINFDWKI